MLKIDKNLRCHGEKYKMLSSFTPNLTKHAVMRIGQRLTKERGLPVLLDIQGQKVRGMKLGHWIHPHTLRLIIEDIKKSIFSTTYYQEGRGLITEGDHGYYVIGPHQEVITIYSEMTEQQKRNSVNVDFRFRTEWLRQSKYLVKDPIH